MICPACITSAALVAGGVTSGGGVVALAIARLRKIVNFRKLTQRVDPKENQS